MTSQHESSRRTARGIAGVVLIACGLVVLGPDAANGQQLPQEDRAAWRKAGARVRDGKDVKVPFLSFQDRPAAGFAKLPAPKVPFILELRAVTLTADDFKDLAGLKTLQQLHLPGGIVTPAGDHELRGLKALAVLQNLRVLKRQTLNPTEASYAEVAALKQLREVHIDRTRLTDVGLTHLGTLPELQVFHSFTGSGENCEAKAVTAAGLKGLAAAPRLREVVLTWFPLDDEGFKHLAGLKDLQTLSVFATHDHAVSVSDEGFRLLAGAAKLSHLQFSVSRSRITDKGIKHLAELKELTRLHLRYAEVTDEGARHLVGLKKLRSLDLSATAISNAGLEHRRGLTNLEYLDLQGNVSLTAAGLKPLHELKNLAELDLYGTKAYGTPARDEQLVELRKSLPKCKINTANSYSAP